MAALRAAVFPLFAKKMRAYYEGHIMLPSSTRVKKVSTYSVH